MKPRIDISALLVLAFCVGLSSSLFLMPFWVKPFLAAAETKNPADWIGFAGNFAAGIMTLIAAIVAWFAVQRQIKAQEQAEERASERHAEQREKEQAGAKYSAIIVLTHTIHAAAAVMNVTEQVLEASAEPRVINPDGSIKPRRIDVARPKLDKVMAQLKATMNHFAVAEAWKDLGIEDKGNYLVVTSTLHTVMNIYDNKPPIPDLVLIRNQHETMSQFATYLRAFDAELADIYERDSKI
jgi:hypothetical protein